MFIFEGRSLDQARSFEDLGVEDNDTIQVFSAAVRAQPAQIPGQQFRGGFEKLLEADVPRQDVLRQRLIFLARTGYLQPEQLQILYLNSELLPPPRGYTAPRATSVQTIFANALRQLLGRHESFEPPLLPNPDDLKLMYPGNPDPEGREMRPEALSMSSFALMFLEAGLPDQLRPIQLIDFSFINDRTPMPLLPARALQLEVLWVTNQSNNQNLIQLAEQNDLLGPHEPVKPVNRVMSSFQRLLTMVVGVLLGLVFNVLMIPFAMHDSMSLELRMGIILGNIGNIFFALFVGLAGSM